MRVIALGFFDGVHLGHAALLHETERLAAELGADAACLTFDRHPGELLGRPVPLLNTVAERAQLMRRLSGIREVLTLPFNKVMMHTPWEDFAAQLLTKYSAVGLVCGMDYSFGDRAEGTPERLRAYAQAHGAVCRIVAPVLRDGAPISSTRIRSALEAGQVEEANAMLGHAHRITGTVIHGKHIGSQLGFPTANIVPDPGILTPRYGVYASRVTLLDGTRHIGVTNIGLRPTLEQTARANVETWLQDYSGYLYGQPIEVELFRFLRPETRFDIPETLRQQVLADAAAARTMLKEEIG